VSGGVAPPFLTLALDGGEWSASFLGHFTLREITPVPIGWEARWVPELVWMLWRKRNLSPARNRTQAVQLLARHYTDRAIPTSNINIPFQNARTQSKSHVHLISTCTFFIFSLCSPVFTVSRGTTVLVSRSRYLTLSKQLHFVNAEEESNTKTKQKEYNTRNKYVKTKMR
jgi:hypothetical protein